jgi:hypothetical protein
MICLEDCEAWSETHDEEHDHKLVKRSENKCGFVEWCQEVGATMAWWDDSNYHGPLRTLVNQPIEHWYQEGFGYVWRFEPEGAHSTFFGTDEDAMALLEVLAERRKQDEKWGEQNHPDGTGGVRFQQLANYARTRCQEAAISDEVTWENILSEEFFEALAEDDEDALQRELIQSAAVIVAWVGAIRRRQKARAFSGDADEG